MGLLVDGVWQDDVSRTKDGHFIRPTTLFRNWVTPDGKSRAPPAKVALPRSRAAITSMFRSPARGHTAPSFSANSKRSRTSSRCRSCRPTCGREGWTFNIIGGLYAATSVNGKIKLSEVYLLAKPRYTGRVSVPVLWDKKRKTIVNNESPEIIRMLNSAFDAFTNVRTDYYPETSARRRSTTSTT